jgi:hypothetical protein
MDAKRLESDCTSFQSESAAKAVITQRSESDRVAIEKWSQIAFKAIVQLLQSDRKANTERSQADHSRTVPFMSHFYSPPQLSPQYPTLTTSFTKSSPSLSLEIKQRNRHSLWTRKSAGSLSPLRLDWTLLLLQAPQSSHPLLLALRLSRQPSRISVNHHGFAVTRLFCGGPSIRCKLRLLKCITPSLAHIKGMKREITSKNASFAPDRSGSRWIGAPLLLRRRDAEAGSFAPARSFLCVRCFSRTPHLITYTLYVRN